MYEKCSFLIVVSVGKININELKNVTTVNFKLNKISD